MEGKGRLFALVPTPGLAIHREKDLRGQSGKVLRDALWSVSRLLLGVALEGAKNFCQGHLVPLFAILNEPLHRAVEAYIEWSLNTRADLGGPRIILSTMRRGPWAKSMAIFRRPLLCAAREWSRRFIP